MNLKFYLRGLGIGIFMTALIMGTVARSHPNTMSESEIRAEAKKLGMVDGRTVLTDTQEQNQTNETSDVSEIEDIEDEKELDFKDAGEPTVSENTTVSDNITVSGNDIAERQEKGSKAEQEDMGNTIVIAIYPGDSSHTVSRRLEEAGIVENAKEYDKYLCQNGYDRKLRVGSFRIPIDASKEEIAKKITGRK